MRRIVSAVAGVVAVACAATAFAAADDTYSVTGKVAKGGSAAKPLSIGASYDIKAVPATGNGRAEAPNTLEWSWSGVKFNQAPFPTCTAAQIDAQQSDSVCPKGSLVADGIFIAAAGPSNDKNSNFVCHKLIRIYNAGKGKEVFFIYGDPTQCAGIAYLAPPTVTIKPGKAGDNAVLAFPENISHPLPGIEGGIVEVKITYKKLTAKKNGKTVGYLQSIGCKGSRTLTMQVSRTSPLPTLKSTVKAGSC